jgi:hypothetical protein
MGIHFIGLFKKPGTYVDETKRILQELNVKLSRRKSNEFKNSSSGSHLHCGCVRDLSRRL